MDQTILLALHHFTSSNGVSSVLAIFFAEWFPYFVVLAAALYAFFEGVSRGMVRSFSLVFAPAALAWIAADAIKSLFPMMRPFAALDLTPLVLGENPLAAFPSAHATFFAALALTIFLQNRKRDKNPGNIGKWFLLAALLIGLARIMAGIHWPSDILAGFLLGGVIAFLAHYVILKFSK